MNDRSARDNGPVPGLTDEERFLLRSFRAFVRRSPESADGLPDGFDRGRISQFCHVNQMGPVVHYLFRTRPLPLREFDHWGKLRMRQLLENDRKLRIAVRLFRAFERAGMRSVGLRGLTLAQLHYPDPGLRPMKDLDLLVDGRDHDHVAEALRPDGLEPAKRLRSQVVYAIDGVEVEVHLSLLTAKRYRAAFGRDELLRSRIPVATQAGEIFRLGLEEELLELVAHAFVHHELQGFGRMIDIALVMDREDLDWDAVVRWCRRARLTNMFLFTLAFIDRLFGLGRDPESRFGRRLPAWSARTFDSYLRLYFGGDSLSHYARRMRNMFYAAERPETKINQFWRMFSSKYVKDMLYLAHKDKAPDLRE